MQLIERMLDGCVWLSGRALNEVVQGTISIRLFQAGSPGTDYFGPQLFDTSINDLADNLCLCWARLEMK